MDALRSRALLVAAIGSLALLASPAMAGTSTATSTPGGSTGAPLKDPAAAHYTVPATAVKGVRAKLTELARIKATAGTGGTQFQHPVPDPSVTSFVIPGTIYDHKEGEGNPCTPYSTGCSGKGHPTYTCAADASRNMTQTMTGKDHAEATFVGWEGIKPRIGLPTINNIADTLNNHFGKYGSWTTHAVTSANDYLAGIETDTWKYHQAVIQDLNTYFFTFWGNHKLAHYDMVYGWNAKAGTVAIAEGWHPTWTFGQKPRNYPDPYGLHRKIPLQEAYNAVAHSATGRYVL